MLFLAFGFALVTDSREFLRNTGLALARKEVLEVSLTAAQGAKRRKKP